MIDVEVVGKCILVERLLMVKGKKIGRHGKGGQNDTTDEWERV